jgi:Helix-turn-helix domain
MGEQISAPTLIFKAVTRPGEWPTSPLDLPLLLTEQQLAHLLGRAVRTLQRHRQEGDSIPFKLIGRRVLYPRDAVLAHFGAGTV